MSNKFNDKELKFVLSHYKEERMNTDVAWKKLATKIPHTKTVKYKRLAMTASITFFVGLLFAIGIYFIQSYKEIKTPTNPNVNRNDTTIQTLVNDSTLNDSSIVFHYKKEPINNVLRDISSIYNSNLVTNDTTKRVTGEFEVNSLEEAINILEMTLDIKIEKR